LDLDVGHLLAAGPSSSFRFRKLFLNVTQPWLQNGQWQELHDNGATISPLKQYICRESGCDLHGLLLGILHLCHSVLLLVCDLESLHEGGARRAHLIEEMYRRTPPPDGLKYLMDVHATLQSPPSRMIP